MRERKKRGERMCECVYVHCERQQGMQPCLVQEAVLEVYQSQ